MQASARAQIILIAVTAAWGLTFPLLHDALRYVSPIMLVFERFLIAILVLAPFVLHKLNQSNRLLVLSGLIIGLLNCGTYVFQNIGLETIDASRGAFITGASVVFVPLLAPLFRLGTPRPIDLLCVACCLSGLYVLTGANTHTLSLGDLWMLGCALCVALTILTIQRVTQFTDRYLVLTFYQLAFTTLISGLLSRPPYVYLGTNSTVWAAILFCSLFATVIALFLQIRYQQDTTATKVALIFTLEPVFGGFFDWLIDHHHLTTQANIGAALILLSIILPTVADKLTGKRTC